MGVSVPSGVPNPIGESRVDFSGIEDVMDLERNVSSSGESVSTEFPIQTVHVIDNDDSCSISDSLTEDIVVKRPMAKSFSPDYQYRLRFSNKTAPKPLKRPCSPVKIRELARTYSGEYSAGDYWLPMDNMYAHGPRVGVFLIFETYFSVIFLIKMASYESMRTLINVERMDEMLDGVDSLDVVSWIILNLVHSLVHIIFLHWLKGNMTDFRGEMRAMTVWEQLDATHKTRRLREILSVVPCVLAYLSCKTARYDADVCIINLFLWGITMLGKLPRMNGVRIFHINETAGIDDGQLHNS